jgi:hypothetical protein
MSHHEDDDYDPAGWPRKVTTMSERKKRTGSITSNDLTRTHIAGRADVLEELAKEMAAEAGSLFTNHRDPVAEYVRKLASTLKIRALEERGRQAKIIDK